MNDSALKPTPIDFDPFAGGELACTVPCTESQREMWASLELGGDDASRAYNESVRLHLKGKLDIDALRASAHTLIARHESLRATFSPDGLQMCIATAGHVDVPLVQLRGLSPAERDRRLGDIARAETAELFDLSNGPLIRFKLAQIADDEHWLFFTAHHIVCDGWSTAVVLAEMGDLYTARVMGRPSALPEPGSFSRYALAEHDFLESMEAKAVEDFWRTEFSGTIPILEFPAENPRPVVRTFRAARVDWDVEPELVQRLKDVGKKYGASYVVTLTAAFQAFMHRMTGQSDLVVAVPSAGQALVGEHHLVGHCVNTLPVRTLVEGDKPFADLLRKVRKGLVDAYENQQLTFGAIVKILKVSRDASRIPLAPVVFNVDMGIDNFAFHGLDATFFSNPRIAENFEINVNASDTKRGLTLECTFNTDLHSVETMRLRMQEFVEVLRGIASDPTSPVEELPILPAFEKQRVLHEWNASVATVPPSCIHELVEAQVDARPEAVAVQFERTSLSYRDMEAHANRLANHLRSRGVTKGSLVGLCVRRTERVPWAILGILKAGAAYVPLDPDYPPDRLAFILEDTDARFVVSETQLAHKVPLGPNVELIDLERDAARIRAATSERPRVDVGPSDLAYVIYTSGSTGKPKGVPIHHRASVNLITSMQQEPGMGPNDVVVAVVTLSFDMSTYEIFVSLASGATCVVVSRDVTLDGRALGELIDRVGGTVLQATPITWRMLVDSGWRGRPGLKAITGGEALTPELAEALLARVGELWNCYGPTETTVYSTAHRVRTPVPPIVIGRAIANTRTYVLDSKRRPVPVGVVGELYLGGEGLTRGYWNRPDLTTERFFRDELSEVDGARMYRTGDLARWTTEGTVQCLHRVDNQVKIRGYRIELGEIESAIRACAGVKDAVVHAWGDAGSEDRALAAYVLAERGRTVEPDALRAELRNKLPIFMIPPHVSVLAEFPLTPNGKVDRNALPKPDALGRRVAPAANAEKPRTPVEEVIMDVWEEVLGRRPSLYDNFFDVGGHSLQALRVIDAANKRGLLLRPTDLFKHPTVESLANAAGFRTPEGAGADSALIALQDTGHKPPLFFLHSLPGDLLHFGPLVQRLGDDQPCYGFHALGLRDDEISEWSIESLASHYVDELTRFQPSGPYHLVGWCYGGTVALEMARRLRERGRELGLVAIMETWPSREPKKQLLYTAKALLKQGRKGLPAAQEKVKRLVGRDRPPADPLQVFALDVDTGPFKNRTVVYARNTEANAKFRTGYYPFGVTLFEAGIKASDQIDEPEYGWREYAEHVKAYMGSGPHEEMLKSPHVDVLAKQLLEAVDAANRRK